MKEREFSVLSFSEHAGVLVSGIHNSYYGNGFVIRFENPTATEIELNLVSLFPNRQVERVNAVEMIQDFSGKVPAYGVASFLVKIK